MDLTEPGIWRRAAVLHPALRGLVYFLGAGLRDLLAKRDLPKTGNIDELIERLVEADSK